MSKITVHSIDSWTHKCQKFVQLDLFISEWLTSDSKITMIYVVWDVHLINDLWANLLINMNIIELKWISMNILTWKIIIEECCNMLVELNISSWKNHTHQVIWFTVKTVILLQSIYQITVKTESQSLSENRDLIFYLSYWKTFKHIVDTNISFVHIQNDLSIIITLLHHTHLNIISEYEEEDCYADSIENINLTVYVSLTKSVIYMSEIYLLNEITIYSKSNTVKVAALTAVMKTYSDL